MTTPVEALLRRRRTVTIAALVLLSLLAWGWLALGAGMGMAPRADFAMFGPSNDAAGGMAEMPGNSGMAAAPGPGLAGLLLAFSMWWVMMVAMMLPAAAPVVLLYARATPQKTGEAPAPIGWFLGGYLAIWGLFSLLAASAQVGLEASGIVSPATMDASGHWLAAAVLIAAGLYQLSPLKEACLAHCRNPAQFLSRHYRPGPSGAFRLGVFHCAWCVGCCWLLMALLFVGGVMNLAWIALLTLLVAGEKLLPRGRLIALAAGVAFIVWGALLVLG